MRGEDLLGITIAVRARGINVVLMCVEYGEESKVANTDADAGREIAVTIEAFGRGTGERIEVLSLHAFDCFFDGGSHFSHTSSIASLTLHR